MADHLVAWLYETPTAVLTPGPEFRITLEWRAEAVERWGAGSPALSVGLPIGAVIGPRDMRGLDFFENVLPEGPTLQRMAAMAGVRPADTYGILKAFARDCAGAIQVLPEGEEPGAGDEGGYSVMTSDDLRRVIGALDVAPLGVAPERGFRPSLAGFQRKALLGRAADGVWQLPTGDAPSTWILKPDGPHAMAANEATCLALAAACGLDAAEGVHECDPSARPCRVTSTGAAYLRGYDGDFRLSPHHPQALRSLRGRGLVKQLGGRGKPTTYHRLAGPGHR